MIIPALQQLTRLSPEMQLYALACAHRNLKSSLAQLNLVKLDSFERGFVDAWQCMHDEARVDLAAVEQAIEALAPAPTSPYWN